MSLPALRALQGKKGGLYPRDDDLLAVSQPTTTTMRVQPSLPPADARRICVTRSSASPPRPAACLPACPRLQLTIDEVIAVVDELYSKVPQDADPEAKKAKREGE